MNRVLLVKVGAVLLMAVAFVACKDQVVTSGAGSNTGNIKMTEVVLNLNCPVDQTVLMNLIEVYGDNSCPKITIKRLDLRNNNQASIEPTFSWLATFKSSFFPLVKEDLEEDINNFKNTALTQEVQRLLTTAQGAGADCYYNSVQANYTFKTTQMNSNNLTAYVNKEVAQGKNKVVFKVLKCTTIQKDSDGDGFNDSVDRCPNVFGRNNGCPPPPPPSVGDIDGDGLIGRDDLCPHEFGPRSNRGCPERVRRPESRIQFSFESSTNSLLWNPELISNMQNSVFEFEFEYSRAGQSRKSGRIKFAVSNSGKKEVLTREILNAGGRNFLNDCHNHACKLKIYHSGQQYQTINISNIDCHIFHN